MLYIPIFSSRKIENESRSCVANVVLVLVADPSASGACFVDLRGSRFDSHHLPSGLPENVLAETYGRLYGYIQLLHGARSASVTRKILFLFLRIIQLPLVILLKIIKMKMMTMNRR